MTEIITVHAATPPWSAVLVGWLAGGAIVFAASYAADYVVGRARDWRRR